MPQSKRAKDNKEDILVQAMLTTASITQIAKDTKIRRETIYRIIKTDSFQEKLTDARAKLLDETIGFMQGNLKECAYTLMSIIRDEETPPQVRVNAINTMFANTKGLAGESVILSQVGVKIVDSI